MLILLKESYEDKNLKRIRVAGLIPMKEGFAFMHRTNVQDNSMHDYYAFVGGGLEDETLEEGTKREIEEELGMVVKVKELYQTTESETMKEFIFLCEYVSGEMGTGNGPEFNGDPKYILRGNYIPVIIPKEEIETLNLVPYEVKEQLVVDIKNGKFDSYFQKG